MPGLELPRVVSGLFPEPTLEQHLAHEMFVLLCHHGVIEHTYDGTSWLSQTVTKRVDFVTADDTEACLRLAALAPQYIHDDTLLSEDAGERQVQVMELQVGTPQPPETSENGQRCLWKPVVRAVISSCCEDQASVFEAHRGSSLAAAELLELDLAVTALRHELTCAAALEFVSDAPTICATRPSTELPRLVDYLPPES